MKIKEKVILFAYSEGAYRAKMKKFSLYENGDSIETKYEMPPLLKLYKKSIYSGQL